MDARVLDQELGLASALELLAADATGGAQATTASKSKARPANSSSSSSWVGELAAVGHGESDGSRSKGGIADEAGGRHVMKETGDVVGVQEIIDEQRGIPSSGSHPDPRGHKARFGGMVGECVVRRIACMLKVVAAVEVVLQVEIPRGALSKGIKL